MKKNLRIVSAAAAALLAVAPVAAAAVVSPATTSVAKAAQNVNIPAGLSNHNAVNVGSINATTKQLANIKEGTAPSSVNQLTRLLVANGLSKGLEVQNIHNVKTSVGSSTETVDFWLDKTSSASSALINSLTSKGYAFGLIGDNNRVVYAGTSTPTPAEFSITLHLVKTPTKKPVTSRPAGQDDAKNTYFATSDGNQYSNNEVVTATLAQNKHLFSDLATKDGHITIDALKHGIKAVLNGTPNALWSTVFGEGNATSNQNLISQLLNQDIDVTSVDGEGSNSSYFKANTTTQFTITVRSNSGKRVQVVFQNTDAVNEDNPVFRVRSDYSATQKSNWGYAFNQPTNVPAINLVKRDSGTFNPLDYIEAQRNAKTPANISFTVNSNDVDWTKPGLYSVKVTSANYNGKQTTVTIPVIVSDANGQYMTLVNDTDVYRQDNSGNMVNANVVNNLLHKGSQVRVFDTKTVNGVQYYRIGSATSNLWVKASDLKNGVTTPANTNESTKTVKIMHIASIYDKNGKKTTEDALRAYNSVSVVTDPVTINGAKFYKLAGKDQYIKVGNVDGTQRTLKHNAYVYRASGKAYMKSKKHHEVLKSGSTVTTYGSYFEKAGKNMYRIGENRYVKVANFR